MFTAQGAQMPIYQISCKSSDFFAYTQEKRAKVSKMIDFIYLQYKSTAHRLIAHRLIAQ